MLTEDEARKKWCPYSGNPNDKEYNRCIASDCMAWKTEYETADYRTDEGYIEFKKMPTDFGDCGLKRK